jgi:hypothetical protein
VKDGLDADQETSRRSDAASSKGSLRYRLSDVVRAEDEAATGRECEEREEARDDRKIT